MNRPGATHVTWNAFHFLDIRWSSDCPCGLLVRCKPEDVQRKGPRIYRIIDGIDCDLFLS